jgi:hypothetical protein
LLTRRFFKTIFFAVSLNGGRDDEMMFQKCVSLKLTLMQLLNVYGMLGRHGSTYDDSLAELGLAAEQLVSEYMRCCGTAVLLGEDGRSPLQLSPPGETGVPLLPRRRE